MFDDFSIEVPPAVFDLAADASQGISNLAYKAGKSLDNFSIDVPMEVFDVVADVSTALDKSGIGAKIGDSLLNAIDPSGARRQIANLLFGGGKPGSALAGAAPAFVSRTESDWRVRVSLATKANYFYKDSNPGILAPLVETNGVIFPYTPTVSVTHTAKYNAQSLTHSNYTNYAYEGSEVQAISIAGEFTAQDSKEAQYVLACVQFFRAASKMWFGAGDNKVGMPPPMVFLSGYGQNYFPNVPCVITSVQHTMPADVDYISTGSAQVGDNGTSCTFKSTSTRIPTQSQITITLQPIYSRKAVTGFNLDDFAKGKLIGSDSAGGFL